MLGLIQGATYSHLLAPRSLAYRRAAVRAQPLSLCASPAHDLDVLSAAEVDALPQRFVLFTDLHVQRSTLPVCLRVLRKVAEEARARSAGVICLGDFWHAGGLLHTRQLNAVLTELDSWGAHTPLLMIPGVAGHKSLAPSYRRLA